MKHFPREALAREIAAKLLGRHLFGDATNGLFLAAPRRTGKSTFLQADLKPHLEANGCVVVYVDLWADQRRDPADLISGAIARAITDNSGILSRAAKMAGLESISLAGAVKFDTTRIGRPDGSTLTDALQMLCESAKKKVVLIIDEAQHALSSEAGEGAMAALKAARDVLNTPDDARLLLVMSGSDRDKLMRLVNTSGAPFYGSTVERMPELDKGFVEFVVAIIEADRPDLKPVDADRLFDAFRLFGSRPQFFAAALGQALNPLTSSDERFEVQVLRAAEQSQQEDERQMESEFRSLRTLEQAVLWRLLDQGTRFRPYDAEALRFYSDAVSRLGASKGKVTAQAVQAALESLRSRTPALVWKSARNEYAVSDSSMHKWYEARLRAGAWPPVESAGI